MVVRICQIPVNSFAHEHGKINGNGIAYHLLDIRLITNKLEIAGKRLNVTPFFR